MNLRYHYPLLYTMFWQDPNDHDSGTISQVKRAWLPMYIPRPNSNGVMKRSALLGVSYTPGLSHNPSVTLTIPKGK